MHVSAELRWFWPEDRRELTAAVERWFFAGRAGVHPGQGHPHDELYVLSTGSELGVKRRTEHAGWEVKGLVGHGRALALSPFRGKPEVWGKWKVPALQLDERRAHLVSKSRALRLLDLSAERVRELAVGEDEQPLESPAPAVGCHIEYTRVTVRGEGAWRTLGFESFGPLHAVEHLLELALHAHIEGAPDLSESRLVSYPAWLHELHATSAAP